MEIKVPLCPMIDAQTYMTGREFYALLKLCKMFPEQRLSYLTAVARQVNQTTSLDEVLKSLAPNALDLNANNWKASEYKEVTVAEALGLKWEQTCECLSLWIMEMHS